MYGDQEISCFFNHLGKLQYNIKLMQWKEDYDIYVL